MSQHAGVYVTVKGFAVGLMAPVSETCVKETVVRELGQRNYFVAIREEPRFILQHATVLRAAVQLLLLLSARREVPAGAVVVRNAPGRSPLRDVLCAVARWRDKVIFADIIIGSAQSFQVFVVAAGHCHSKELAPVEGDLQAKVCLQDSFQA